jgi:hypothetical protein
MGLHQGLGIVVGVGFPEGVRAAGHAFVPAVAHLRWGGAVDCPLWR